MVTGAGGGYAPKVYCERCNIVFNSRSEFERHFGDHSGTACESCPIDTVLARLVRLFKRA